MRRIADKLMAENVWNVDNSFKQISDTRPLYSLRFIRNRMNITLANKFRVIYGNMQRRAVAEPSAAGIILYKCSLIVVDTNNKLHEERVIQWKNLG